MSNYNTVAICTKKNNSVRGENSKLLFFDHWHAFLLTIPGVTIITLQCEILIFTMGVVPLVVHIQSRVT